MQGLPLYAFAVVALSLYGVMSIISKKMYASVPPFAFIAVTMLVLCVLAFTASLLFEKSAFVNLKAQHLGFLGLFGVINFVGFALFLYAIGHMPVANYQLLGASLSPIIVSVLAYLFLGEAITLRLFLAVPIALLGLYIALK